jgi:hypothetical protein
MESQKGFQIKNINLRKFCREEGFVPQPLEKKGSNKKSRAVSDPALVRGIRILSIPEAS